MQSSERKRGHARLRVLIVEDHANTAAALRKLLDLHGFEARTAGSYKEALTAGSEWVPDVLVCDIGLPGKDGVEVMRSMRQAYPGLRGIVVSGHTSPEDQARSREAGFSEHLTKPISGEKLASTIRRLFELPD